jgi:hypothetical protein
VREAADVQERTGGSTIAAVWIGIIAALVVLLGIITFIIFAWRRSQSKTSENDVAYDVETEFKEEAADESEMAFDDGEGHDLNIVNSPARRAIVDMNSDEFGTGGDESVFEF